jgi:hypothetical protein
VLAAHQNRFQVHLVLGHSHDPDGAGGGRRGLGGEGGATHYASVHFETLVTQAHYLYAINLGQSQNQTISKIVV